MPLNIPNTLTIFRLVLIPAYTYMALSESFSPHWLAAIIFGIAALTDWLDGLAARKFNQVTEFGKIADPAVDRIVIITALIILYFKISVLVPLWAVVLLASRDVLLIVGWLYFNHLGRRITVSSEGKLTTAILMFSVFFLLLDLNYAILNLIGVGLFYIGLALSIFAAFNYAKLGAEILVSNKTIN